jgi:N-carbamoylputrescine amidase
MAGEWPDGLYEAELRVAAFQNGYFTALANRVGGEPTMTFAGESFVCDPGGRVIARGPAGAEAIVYADLDVSQVRTCHARQLFLRDRRPEIMPALLDLNKSGPQADAVGEGLPSRTPNPESRIPEA